MQPSFLDRELLLLRHAGPEDPNISEHNSSHVVEICPIKMSSSVASFWRLPMLGPLQMTELYPT